VALSLLAGLFIALLIGTSAWLVYVGLSFRRIVQSTSATLAEHRTQWANALTDFRTMLDLHRTQFDAQIKSINGRQIGEAVAQLVQLVKEERIAAQRIERAAIAVGRFTAEWLSDRALNESLEPITEGIDQSTGYAAAEPGERFVSTSRTAADDAAAIADESRDVTSTATVPGSFFDNPDRTP
jgi:hypothetical protein